MRVAAFLLVHLLAAGCAGPGTAPPEAPAGPEAGAEATRAPDPVEAMAADDLRIECDRARVVIPDRLRDRAVQGAPGVRPFILSVGALRIEAREVPPALVVQGESFSIVLEGAVVFHRVRSGHDQSEGPYRTVVIRDGRTLLR